MLAILFNDDNLFQNDSCHNSVLTLQGAQIRSIMDQVLPIPE